MYPAPATNLLSAVANSKYKEALKDTHERRQTTGEYQFDTDIFRIDDVLQMRKDKVTYFPFLELFGPAVVGKNKWKRHRRHRPFGKCLTVSDEAFIILCYENFKLVWVEQYWQDSTAISSKVCVIFVLWNI